jgi:hypothetical protein
VVKGEDVVLLLKLLDAPVWTMRSLAHERTVRRSVVHRSLGRWPTPDCSASSYDRSM